MNNRWKWDFKG